jgi:DNA-binding GntR family transcriptional regulator
MSGLLSFTEQARRSGLVPETCVLKFEDREHPSLGNAIYLERLRSVDGVPVIYEKRWLAKPVCAALTVQMASGSLYEALRSLGIEISHAEQRARAVSPGTEERSHLQIRQGWACLRVEGRGYLEDNTVIWEENTLFRGDRYEIHGILSPNGTSSGYIIQ